MRYLCLMAMIVTSSVSAQHGGGIGYPSVAVALDALKARNDVAISVQGGWTIVSEEAPPVIWSFSPADHPAHPAAVRRAIVSKGGNVYVEMTALCQSTKAACDKLMEDFKVLNAQMSAALASPKTNEVKWTASRAQTESVDQLSRTYFSAKDEARYQEAYALLAPSLQQMTSFARWSFLAQLFNGSAGQVLHRDIRKVTWYKDPPQTAPGIYAAVDFSSQFENVNVHCGYIVLSEQADGSFQVIREEENFVDKVTEGKLKPGELDKFRAQFKCK